MTYTNISKPLKDFAKVCKVSHAISTICQIQGRGFLEEALLDKWEEVVLGNQQYRERVAFIMAKDAFIKYLRRQEKTPIIDFIIDTLYTI